MSSRPQVSTYPEWLYQQQVRQLLFAWEPSKERSGESLPDRLGSALEVTRHHIGFGIHPRRFAAGCLLSIGGGHPRCLKAVVTSLAWTR